MPTFEKSPPELVARFDELAALVPDAGRKQMFGYPTCVLNGNMFLGLHGDRLVLRLSEGERVELMGSVGGATFEPMPGRQMKEYVALSPDLARRQDVEPWVRRAHDYAATLPAKHQKA